MLVEVGKSYYDASSDCVVTVLEEYPRQNKIMIKISNRVGREVIKKPFVERSVTREVCPDECKGPRRIK